MVNMHQGVSQALSQTARRSSLGACLVEDYSRLVEWPRVEQQGIKLLDLEGLNWLPTVCVPLLLE